MNENNNDKTPDSELAVSLVRDDTIFSIQRRLGLIPKDSFGIFRRVLFWSMLAWLPITGWAFFSHRIMPGAVTEPLLGHFGIHIRFLVAIPLFILAESMTHSIMVRYLPQFVRSGVIPKDQIPAFRAVLDGMIRLRNSSWPWVVIAIIAASWTFSGAISDPTHELIWAIDSPDKASEFKLGFGGWWYILVARPLFLILLFGWLWRIALFGLMFKRISKLQLAIVPTHPDHAGGLGFLEEIPKAFSLVVLAISSVIASSWAHQVAYHHIDVLSLKAPMIFTALILLLIFLAPFMVFAPVLAKTRKQALLDYGSLVSQHGDLVRRRWVLKEKLEDDSMLNAPELGCVADAGVLYENAKAMRALPLGKTSIASILIPILVPFICVFVIQIPFKTILSKLLGALI